jgi:signal transduction histidine kinase
VRSLSRALFVLGALGFIAGAVPLALALEYEGGHQRELIAVFGPLTGWAFIGTGIFAWLRRPENSLGALMIAIGFTACLGSLRVAEEPWIFITGLVFITLPYGVLYHMLLAFPSGTLATRLERVLVLLMYLSVIVAHPISVLFQDTTRMGLPENPLLVSNDPDLSSTISRTRFWVGLVLLGALAVILIRRWHGERGVRSSAMLAALLSGGLVMALLGIWYLAILAHWDPDLIQRMEEARIVSLALVPFAFLAGVLRSRVAGAAAIRELVTRLGDPRERTGLRDALADALADPSLALAYWLPDRGEYVDADGRPVEIPAEGSDRMCTPVESRGERVAAIIHDASLRADQELVRAVGAAASLTLENERLDAELRAKVEELQASRARIIESGDAARRRIERDLHDGAQQRLVSLALSLRLVQLKVEEDPEAVRELEAARRQLEQALEELRELARGIHPSVLSDRGLDAVLEGLASRAPLPVELDAALGARLPATIESTAYFVVAEALTNVARYSRATHARVKITRENGRVLVEVSDDGVGGADPAHGSGLRGLLDRIAALDGRLEVDSEPGHGTIVRATIPCA